MSGLKFGKYTFTCRLNAPAILPEYKGSTFRGVYMMAFKDMVCILKRRDCRDCPLGRQCLYAAVFETADVVPPRKGLRGAKTPHPFVLQPPETPQRHFARGNRIQFNLLLFGELNTQWSFFVDAIRRAGKVGIGKRVNGQAPTFELEEVLAGEHAIYRPGNGDMGTFQELESLNLSWPEKPTSISRIGVTLKTPLRLKYKNQIARDLPFHLLARAMLRRISSLFLVYAGEEPDLDYKGLLERAEAIQISEKNLYWHDWERYSNRQKQRMPMGGMEGTITYEGNLGEFLPLLEICSKINIGKNTGFGLGRIGVSFK